LTAGAVPIRARSLDPLVKTRVFGMTPSMRLIRVSGIISPFAAVRVAGLA
jgi:hypothetical protein